MNPAGGQRVAATFPSSMTFVQMNVTSKEDWKNLVAKAVDEHGKVDVLVNNAGTSYKNKVCFLFLFLPKWKRGFREG